MKNHIAQNDAKGLRSTRFGSVSYGDDTNLNLSRRNVLPISGVPQTESYVQQSNGPLLNQRASYNLNYNPGNSRRNYQGY